MIRLLDIDVFWRTLDFTAVKCFEKEQELDVDAEFENLKATISETPYQVKKSFFQKFTQIIKGTSPKKPPVVQTRTRGRPTLKQQESRKEEAARKSSYTPSQEDSEYSFDYPRHSSYIPSQEDLVRPSTSQQYIPGFPLLQSTEETKLLIRKYGDQIPSVFHPYISKIQDVRPYGHCGFRSVAVGLGLDQDKYMYIRKQLLIELRSNRNQWENLFDPDKQGHYDRLYESINFQGVGRADEPNWMQMPGVGFLIAQRWGYIPSTLEEVQQFSL